MVVLKSAFPLVYLVSGVGFTNIGCGDVFICFYLGIPNF